MRRLALAAVLFQACDGEAGRGASGPPEPAPAPDGLAIVVSLPRLGEGLGPIADFAEDLLPGTLDLADGRKAAVSLTGLGDAAERRIDDRRPAFVLLFGLEDPPVWVLPVREDGPIEAPRGGFARVVGGTALVSESGQLLDDAEAYATGTLARSRPDALTVTLLPGDGRVRTLRALETSFVSVARDIESSAREARGRARTPPTLGDPEAIGGLVEDLAREMLASLSGEGDVRARVTRDRDTLRVDIRVTMQSSIPPSATPPAVPSTPRAMVRWSSVRSEDERLSSARWVLDAFARIAGARLDAAERETLGRALDRFERARGEGASWALGTDGVAGAFAVPHARREEAIAAARDLASLAGQGHLGRVLGSLDLAPVTVEETDGAAVLVRLGASPGDAVTGRGGARGWRRGTISTVHLDLVQAVAALGPLGGARTQAFADVLGRTRDLPPVTFRTSRADGHWSASLVLPRPSVRALGRAIRRSGG